MKAYTTLYDDTVPELPGAELSLVLHHIKRTCNDFYARSGYGREDLAPIDVTSGLAAYQVLTGDIGDLDVSRILGVRLADPSSSGTDPKVLDSKTPEQLDIDQPGWRTQGGTVCAYTQTAFDTIVLANVPAQDYPAGLLVKISRVPLYDGDGIDDVVFEKFAEGIAFGVKARLMRMPKKPWSNDGLARSYQTAYDLTVAAAGAQAEKSFGRAPLRVVPCP